VTLTSEHRPSSPIFGLTSQNATMFQPDSWLVAPRSEGSPHTFANARHKRVSDSHTERESDTVLVQQRESHHSSLPSTNGFGRPWCEDWPHVSCVFLVQLQGHCRCVCHRPLPLLQADVAAERRDCESFWCGRAPQQRCQQVVQACLWRT
jgi:hypothetical protein